MNISNIAGAYGANDPEKVRKNATSPQKKNDNGKVGGKKALSDEVNISVAAKEAFNDRVFEKMVKELPSERQEEVERARQKLESGELLSRENIDATADRILKGLSAD